ncbi:4-hydroxy-tetrahydrodipicolinate reductase [Pseudidiomarina aestuarii]|uniref:4-hydroxy-tetrahydrodipicolinate reductase n=1 Tax=Pseudidiomarina aestuarii TaxID=624146 RepID=UPI003A97EE03
MRIGVFGASGRMGQAVLRELDDTAGVSAGAAIVHAQSSRLGALATDELQYQTAQDLEAEQVDALIDFSLPSALAENSATALRLRVPLVVCTTGLEDDHLSQLHEAAERIPVLYAANTSLGVTLLKELVTLASRALPDADIEIVEAHHSAKRDAPSGTALLLGQAAAQGRQQDHAAVSAGVRGNGIRKQGSIGYAAIRAGDIIGEHTVYLVHAGERIELTHRVSNRQVFAAGAVHAARWLAGQPAGFYQMSDVLDVNIRGTQ